MSKNDKNDLAVSTIVILLLVAVVAIELVIYASINNNRNTTIIKHDLEPESSLDYDIREESNINDRR